MVDETGSRRTVKSMSADATLAALHSYRAVYGNAVWRGSEPIMAGLHKFWLGRFRKGSPPPFGISPAPDEQAPTAREAVPSPRSPSKALEGNGR